jgi:uncharacterized Zn finger protein
MNRKKQIKCPHCGQEQVVHLLATPGKFAQLVGTQVVRCVNVRCGLDVPVLDTEKIVDGPYEV